VCFREAEACISGQAGLGALYMLKDERGSIVAYVSENTGNTNGTV